MRRNWIRDVSSLISLLALGAAALALNHLLQGHGHGYHGIRRAVAAIPASRVDLAIALTLASYAVAIGYDRLALRYLGRALPLRQTALASFLGFAFSHGLGLSVLGGATLRYRLYARWEVTPLEVTKLVGFTSVTFWLGSAFVFALAVLVAPQALDAFGVATFAARGIALALLLLALAFPALSALRRRPLTLGEVEVEVPRPPVVVAQLALSLLDWTLAASVLYVLLPQTLDVPFVAFLALFVVAMAAGVASRVPGGLGVFESLMLLGLAGEATITALAGALVAFRMIYNLLPLAIAALVLGGIEAAQRRGQLLRLGGVLGRWVQQVAPRLLAITIFLGGVLLLATGAVPAREARLGWLDYGALLPAVELSHFLASLVGLGLVLLASAVQNRLDAAYLLSVALLALGAVLALLRGLHWEEALVLLGMLAVLLPCRPLFYRRASILGDLLSPGWIVAVTAAVGGAIWLGFFAYRHVEYSHELWWEFAFFSGAPRFLRASVGVLVVTIVFATAHLLRPATAVATPPDATTLERVRAIVAASPSAAAHLALLGDKSFLLDDDDRAFLMYATSRSCWVAMGDPVGPLDARTELVWRFRELCDHYDVHPCSTR